MARKIYLADLLCGAGGTTEGIIKALLALGFTMEQIVIVCVNHWPVAIETHKLNHPEARHYIQDIAVARPHLIVPEGYLDLLTASPTCTHHSVARGGKPTSDQQRSDPWHIITWFTELRVKRALIENVWEYTSWGPVDPRTGRPVKGRKGEYHLAWLDTIRKLGATSIEYRKINSANYGGATTRVRYINKIRFDKVMIGWAPITHRKREEGRLDLFPGIKPWRPAREIIDWSIKGRSIFNRPVPLAPKTLARILAGAIKFDWPRPYRELIARELQRSLRHAIGKAFALRHARKKAVRERAHKQLREYIHWLRTRGDIRDQAGTAVGRAKPIVVILRKNAHGRSTELPIPALAASGNHIGLAQPFVLSTGSSGAPRSTEEPIPTATTGGAGSDRPGCARPMVVEPFILNRHGDNGGSRAHSLDAPAPASDCRGAGYLVEPFITTVAHGNEAGDRTADTRRSHSIQEPLGAIHGTGIAHAVVEPFMLSRQGGGAPRSTLNPTPAQVAQHSHILIAPYYGSGSGETCTSGDEPLPSPTTKARFGMVVPVTHNDGSDRARDVDIDPIPTVTTAKRGELAFITAQFGERPGQAPRVHDIDQPAPTPCATGHINLVEAAAEYDVLFRMFEVPELAAAMGLARFTFTGTKTDQIKQIGNAVSAEMMEAEVKAFMADAVPKVRRSRAAVRAEEAA